MSSLLEKTQRYWKLSRNWHQINDPKEEDPADFTAQEATRECVDILSTANPDCRLNHSAMELRQDIIQFGNKYHKQRKEARQ